MKRANWVRLIAMILVISMLAAPVSAATVGGSGHSTNGLIGSIIGIIKDIIIEIIDDWFDIPGVGDPDPTEPPVPTTPEEPTPPSEPVATDPTEPEVTEPEVTEPEETEPEVTEPVETEPAVETVLELVEDFSTVENGHLLRGTTYTLSQIVAQQPQTAPYALRSSPVSTLADEGTTGGSNSEFIEAEKKVFTNWVDGSQYYIQCSRAYTSPVDSWLAVEDGGIVGVADTSSATPFTLTITKYGEYYLSATIDGAVKYLTFTGSSANGDSFSDTPVALTIEHMTNSDNRVTDDGNLLQIGYNGNYLNQHGSKTSLVYGAYDTSGDMGNAMWMYLIDGSETKKVVVETVPVTVKVVYFPVTMFNYNTDAINNATKAQEYDSKSDTWNGIYFSGGTPSGNDYVITVPGKPTVTTVYEVTYERVTPTISNNRITNLDANADYILVNKRSGRAVTVGTSGSNDGSNMKLVDSADLGLGQELASAPESFKVTYEAANSDNASIWKYYSSNGSRYFRTTSNTYMTFTDSSSGTGTSGTALSFGSVSSDSNAITIYYTQSVWFTTTYYYLSDYGGSNRDYYRGYTTAGDLGNPFYIYKRVSVEPVTVTVPNDTTETYTKNGYAGHNYFNKGGGKADGDLVWTGLAAGHLDENENIVFNYPDGGIFSYDPSKINAKNGYFDGVKNVYEFVGMPFILTKDGHYIFDSDQNGVYFKDTDGDTYNDPAPGTSDAYKNMQLDYGVTQPLHMAKGGGVADGSQNGWFPFNLWATRTVDGVTKTGYGMIDPEKYDNKNMDYHFGMRADLPFSMTANGRVKSTDDTSEEIIFRFSGDDDVWIYIDGQQVVDLGGMHNRLDIEIDFAKNTVTYSEHTPADENSGQPANNDTGSYNDPENWKAVRKLFKENANDTDSLLPYTRYQFAANENHELQFFYLERGRGTSNCRVEFNLPMTDTVCVTKVANESWSAEAAEADKAAGNGNDGTYGLNQKEQAIVDQIPFGFTLYKKVAGATTFEPVRSTNYYLVDKDGNSILDSEGNPIVDHTDENGHFYLKNGQTAKFMTEIPMTGVSYYVVEDKTPDGFLTPDFQFKGTATNGFDWYNAEGVKQNQDRIRDASVIPEQEIPMDWEGENKSYTLTAYGSVEATDSLEFICVNYLDAKLPNPSALAMEDIIVIDYGLPVHIDPLANDLYRGDKIEIVAWGDDTLTLDEVLDENHYAVDHDDPEAEEKTSWDGTKVFHSGEVRFLNDAESIKKYGRETFDYTLTKQLTHVEIISYIVRVESTIGDSTFSRYALAKVYIVPATIMYYEENFTDLVHFEFLNGAPAPTFEKENAYISDYQEPGVVGDRNDSTYGSDVAYLSDPHDSNGTSYFFDTTNGAVRFWYTFTGTGTSFFARTSATTGYMQVLLFAGDQRGSAGQQLNTYYRDTYFYKGEDDHTKTHDTEPLYNIPVYTVDELPYGTYTVLVTVAKKGTKSAGPMHPEEDGTYMKRSMHEFYLDGIRVMQPLDGVYMNRKDMKPDEYGTISGLIPIPDKDRTPITNKALDAYTTDNESNLDIVTLRTKLIDENYFPVDPESGKVEEAWPFVVLTDTNDEIIYASQYVSIGPKEEVYLKPGQKVRFSLKYWEPEGLSLYIGMKAPFGNGATVKVGNTPYSIGNATDCYRDVTKSYASQELIDPKDGSQPYYVITYTFEVPETPGAPETASKVVALTNIKVVGSHEFTILENEEVYE